MTLRNVLIALVTACIMAWTISARAQHSGPPGNSPEEECVRQCHVRHCDEYVDCIGRADPTLCRRNANLHEAECFKQCEPAKT